MKSSRKVLSLRDIIKPDKFSKEGYYSVRYELKNIPSFWEVISAINGDLNNIIRKTKSFLEADDCVGFSIEGEIAKYFEKTYEGFYDRAHTQRFSASRTRGEFLKIMNINKSSSHEIIPILYGIQNIHRLNPDHITSIGMHINDYRKGFSIGPNPLAAPGLILMFKKDSGYLLGTGSMLSKYSNVLLGKDGMSFRQISESLTGIVRI